MSVPPKTKRKPIVDRMAQTMAEHSASHGACTENDLKAAGFSLREIAEYADAARIIARTAGPMAV